MTEYALLIDNEFKEIRNYQSKPQDIPHKKVTWHDVVRDQGETAFTGLENGNWVIRTALPTFTEIKSNKLADLAAYRWEKETGGTTFNGMLVATDAVSQTKYVGAVVASQIDPLINLKWKLSSGDFVSLNAESLIAVSMAVRTHIQACFDRESELKILIDSAISEEELDAINITTGWPT